MNVMRLLAVILCLLAVTACDESSAAGPTVALRERFTLAPSQIASIQDTGLRVQFVEVTGDSRCPANAICIQGGDAIVHVRVSGGGSTSAYQLHTGDSSLAAVTHNEYRITLVELQPYPFSSQTISPGEYRASFVATR